MIVTTISRIIFCGLFFLFAVSTVRADTNVSLTAADVAKIRKTTDPTSDQA